MLVYFVYLLIIIVYHIIPYYQRIIYFLFSLNYILQDVHLFPFRCDESDAPPPRPLEQESKPLLLPLCFAGDPGCAAAGPQAGLRLGG